jgi:hypothetical protein
MLLLRPLITLCVLLSNLKVGTVLKFGSENRKTTQYLSTCKSMLFFITKILSYKELPILNRKIRHLALYDNS